MSRVPSFRYMGGKSRLRKWLVSHFPKFGHIYLEPFVGLGNVFYHAKTRLEFDAWYLGDTNPFLTAVMAVDLDALPDSVSRTEFQFWRDSTCEVSKVIEPKITFAGKGYTAGFDGGHPSHPAYNGRLHRILLEEAKRLLTGVSIEQCCWTAWDYTILGSSDFVYFDPPYIDTVASYPNIDHALLVSIINGLECRWALSGYDNTLYRSSLDFAFRYEKERNSEIKGSNSGKYEAVTEILWTNFEVCGG